MTNETKTIQTQNDLRLQRDEDHFFIEELELESDTAFDYRVFKEDDEYSIREAYFERDRSIRSWTLNPLSVVGKSIGELNERLKLSIDLCESALTSSK